MLFRSEGASLENLRDTPGLEMDFIRTPMSRTLLLIFVMLCTGVESKLLKPITESRMGKISDKWMSSVHPYICKYGKFPVGHPKVYVGADCLDREGIMKCKVLPPRKLFHPVLSYKSNSKLMVPLCSACADTMN